MLIVYGIINCDTVKRARAWLTAQGIEFDFHDFKKAGLSEATLAGWLTQRPWELLLNMRGTTWRKLPPEVQAAVVDAATAQELLLRETSAIKRPILEKDGVLLAVGFAEAEWKDLLLR